MKKTRKDPNLVTLADILGKAEQGGYAVGSFSARYTPMIAAVKRAGETAKSPLIVQISSRELGLYDISPAELQRNSTGFWRMKRSPVR